MSLKAFHIVFVVACVAMFLFCGAWATTEYQRVNGTTHLAMAVCSFACVGASLAYGWWFVRKVRGLN